MPATSTPRSAFTLLELLIVVAVIAALMLMTLSSVVSIREKARMTATSARMQNVLNGLATYASNERSACYALQSAIGLGGVLTYSSIKVINDSLVPACSKPPGFTQVQKTPTMASPSKIPFDFSSHAQNPEQLTLWRRLIEEVFDVMPPTGAVWALADYQNPAKGGWPTQWPETDWDQSPPGTNPPILRFPWGKPGLRADGTICDPVLPAALTGANYAESTTWAGFHYVQTTALLNEWVTCGAPATTRIWNWTSANNLQSDAVLLTTASRSDGTAVPGLGNQNTNSNSPMPFDMGWMSPLATIGFLQAAGVLTADTGADDFRNNRKPSAAWNDAWGHPLIVVYAMFQPERFSRTFDDLDRRDLLLKASMRAYQFDRELYVAVAAMGPVKPDPLPDTWAPTADTTTLRDYWMQLRDITQAADWNESSFAAPPKAWNQSVRLNERNGCRSLVTTVRGY
jgi:prepilin-type N-terminal cleavage/methylation domain-containing protein